MQKANFIFVTLLILLGIVVYFYFSGEKEGFESSSQITDKITRDVNNLAEEVNKLNAEMSPAYTADNTSKDNSNYNHYTRDSIPFIYYSSDGSVALLSKSNGLYTITITDKNGNVKTYRLHTSTYNIYYGPNNETAQIVVDKTGKASIHVIHKNGQTIAVYNSSVKPVLNLEINSTPYLSGTSAESIAPSRIISNINAVSPTTPSSYKEAYKINTTYNSSLPTGIPKRLIPPGNEDLYILKSEVVPPVCPACPAPIMTCPKNDASKCPPCPACARCPEPSFECKKVPNYSGTNQYLPQPVVNNFSTFGM